MKIYISICFALLIFGQNFAQDGKSNLQTIYEIKQNEGKNIWQAMRSMNEDVRTAFVVKIKDNGDALNENPELLNDEFFMEETSQLLGYTSKEKFLATLSQIQENVVQYAELTNLHKLPTSEQIDFVTLSFKQMIDDQVSEGGVKTLMYDEPGDSSGGGGNSADSNPCGCKMTLIGCVATAYGAMLVASAGCAAALPLAPACVVGVGIMYGGALLLCQGAFKSCVKDCK